MTRFYFTLYDDDRETKNDGIMEIRLNRYTFLVQFRCRRRITDCDKSEKNTKRCNWGRVQHKNRFFSMVGQRHKSVDVQKLIELKKPIEQYQDDEVVSVGTTLLYILAYLSNQQPDRQYYTVARPLTSLINKKHTQERWICKHLPSLSRKRKKRGREIRKMEKLNGKVDGIDFAKLIYI